MRPLYENELVSPLADQADQAVALALVSGFQVKLPTHDSAQNPRRCRNLRFGRLEDRGLLPLSCEREGAAGFVAGVLGWDVPTAAVGQPGDEGTAQCDRFLNLARDLRQADRRSGRLAFVTASSAVSCVHGGRALVVLSLRLPRLALGFANGQR